MEWLLLVAMIGMKDVEPVGVFASRNECKAAGAAAKAWIAGDKLMNGHPVVFICVPKGKG